MRHFQSNAKNSRDRSLVLMVLVAAMTTAICQPAAAATLCVKAGGTNGCFATIGAAVAAATANDTITVARGTYKEYVVIGKPLSLIGAGASVIDATGLAHGIFVDGYDNPGLQNVTVKGFTVQNALYEGVLVVSVSGVTIRDNNIIDNDTTPDLGFTGAPTGCPGQPGDGIYENDETGDCGGAIHLIGVSSSTVSGNYVTGNADGLLISDETGASQRNLVTRNKFINNPLECGIVLASHPPSGNIGGPHHGVFGNTVTNNTSTGNGVAVGGSGIGLFSDGIGQGRVSDNVISHNTLTGNGIGGVNLHTHVGPAFGLPADNMDNNTITGNYIANNLADTADTATPGRDGININSGGGGSPVTGTVIALNVIWDEDVDVAINTPATVEIHFNALLGGNIGVANICAYDGASICGGVIDATWNYWGCPGGPGAGGKCSSIPAAYATDVLFRPWLP